MIPKSPFALMDVSFSQKTVGQLCFHGSFDCFQGPLFESAACGASDKAGFLAAGGRLRAVLTQPGMAALPLRACIQLFLQRHGTHVAAIRHQLISIASCLLKLVLRKSRRMRSMRSRRTPMRGAWPYQGRMAVGFFDPLRRGGTTEQYPGWYLLIAEV